MNSVLRNVPFQIVVTSTFVPCAHLILRATSIHHKAVYRPYRLNQTRSRPPTTVIAAAQFYFDQGISATKKYETGWNKYLAFCDQCKQQAIPASEGTLVLFITHLANQQLSHTTIQVYLSAVCYLHIANKEYHTFTTCVTPRLGQVLKDIQKMHALTHSPKERQPITFSIMERIHSLLSNSADNYYNSMIWAACCTAYFGLLRVSKFNASSCNHSSSLTDLLMSDIAIDSHVAPQVISITLKQSKTDQYRQGTHIYLGRTSHPVCPVKALIHYLGRHGGRPGPLFILSNNQLPYGAKF